ncbi:AI-2E family transporter [Pseudobythopirellula maris]|uniref:AI-2E family transporter n=1 Tax=Pseudobythopirellula maris TaxID=2527991 RepID=UPI0018D430F1|nr:AI-2E family transporter [Pseudobythopirellula maris]
MKNHEAARDKPAGKQDPQQNEEDAENEARMRKWRTTSLVLLAGLAFFYTLYFAKAVLMPITLAVMLSFVLKPVVGGLRRIGLPNAASATLIFVVSVAVLGAGATYLAEPAKAWISQAPRDLAKIGRDMSGYFEPLERIEKARDEVAEMTKTPGAASPIAVRVEQPPLTSQLMSSTGGVLASGVICLSLLFFLLSAGDRFLEKTVELAPTRRAKREVVEVLREIEHRISLYLGAITLINAGLGAVIGLGLWLIGMPNPVLWGVMAMLLNYIPFVGLVAGTLTVWVAAMASLGSPGQALLAPLIYLGANGVEANLITPYTLGKSNGLNPVVILLAVFLSGWVWGVVGIFLAVPLLIAAKILCESVDSLNPIAVYLSP